MNPLLEQVVGQFRKLRIFGGGIDSVLGIDLGSSAIKVVELKRRRGKATLVQYGSLALGPYAQRDIGEVTKLSNEKLAEAAKVLFTEVGLGSKAAFVSIPLKSSLLLLIEIPPVPESKLASVIPTEARKYIPASSTEVSINWIRVPRKNEGSGWESAEKKDEGKMRILVAVIHNTVLQAGAEFAQRVGLESTQFEIETFSIMRSVFGTDHSSYAILDIGAGSTKVAIVDEGVVAISHTVGRGSQNITQAIASAFGLSFGEAEKLKREAGLTGSFKDKPLKEVIAPIMDYIFFDADRVIHDYEVKYGQKMKKVALVGGGALLKGMVAHAGEALKRETVQGDPFGKVEAPAAFFQPILKEAGPEFAVAVGLALRGLDEFM